MYHIESMRTTVTLDKDVYEAASHLSRVSGKRLGQILSELARKGLKAPAPGAVRTSGGFAVFDVPADAPIIPASRVQQFIDDEGLF